MVIIIIIEEHGIAVERHSEKDRYGRSSIMDGKMQGRKKDSQHDNDVHKNRLDYAE